MQHGTSFFTRAGAFVVLGVVLAFLTIGTPAHIRELNLDNERAEALEAWAPRSDLATAFTVNAYR